MGKGVTFDTGGLNLKPTGSIEDMYGDKGGACAVMGALKGTLELGSKKNIIFACGFAENAIGSSAFKPGDIIKGMKGLSVEIGNTDAEGRLVLADTFVCSRVFAASCLQVQSQLWPLLRRRRPGERI